VVAQYNATVLTAVREAADALGSVQSLERQQTEQAAALASAEKAWQIARDRYRAGLTNYLGVLNAESQWLAQQRAAVDLQARRATAAVDLATALGGGWQAEPAATAAVATAPTLNPRHVLNDRIASERAWLAQLQEFPT
jgi:outer membrane protein TolC